METVRKPNPKKSVRDDQNRTADSDAAEFEGKTHGKEK
jgi:hypothetical protein